MDVVFDLGNVVLNWNVDEILESLDNDAGEKSQLRLHLFEHPDWLDMDRGLLAECRSSPEWQGDWTFEAMT